jgi:hypothetical protein
MTRHTHAPLTWFALAVFVLGLGAAGCSSDGQLGPNPRPASIDDGWARIIESSASGPATQGTKPLDADVPTDSLVTYHGATTINGAVGGRLDFGRYVLTFPPKCFKGTVTIRIETDNTGYVDCRLYPEGMKFDNSVTLSMSLTGTTQDAAGSTIYWYDPVTGTWVDMKGVYDASTHNVTVGLKHFSQYRGGRAGW